MTKEQVGILESMYESMVLVLDQIDRPLGRMAPGAVPVCTTENVYGMVLDTLFDFAVNQEWIQEPPAPKKGVFAWFVHRVQGVSSELS
jgi:hypothetical protein